MVTRKTKAKTRTMAAPIPAGKMAALTLLTFAIYMVLCATAHAETTPMGDVLCTVIGFIIDGNLGRGLATLAIIIVGVGALLGKASWGLALTVGIGISVIFGAPDIVNKLVSVPAC